MWLDAAGNIKDESREFDDTFEQDGQEVGPVINWHRDSAKERKHAERKTTSKSDKQRGSNWVSGFVNGADDHAKQAKLDALRITLPATVTTKGK